MFIYERLNEIYNLHLISIIIACMKRLITDIYKILYRITSNKIISVIIAVLYLSALNLVTIYGLVFLLKNLEKKIKIILIFFSYPYFIYLSLTMLLLNFWLLTPFKNLSKEKRIRPFVAPIIVYSLVSLVLFLCSRYFDKIFIPLNHP